MEGGLGWLMLYTRVCGLSWILVYLALSLVLGLMTHITLHLMIVGLMICLVSYFRLPPPNPTIVRQVLGTDPSPGLPDSAVGKIFRLREYLRKVELRSGWPKLFEKNPYKIQYIFRINPYNSYVHIWGKNPYSPYMKICTIRTFFLKVRTFKKKPYK